MDPIIDQFEAHLQKSGKEPSTTRCYISDIKHFYSFLLENNSSIEKCDHTFFKSYENHLIALAKKTHVLNYDWFYV